VILYDDNHGSNVDDDDDNDVHVGSDYDENEGDKFLMKLMLPV